jgi:hypothetical protein
MRQKGAAESAGRSRTARFLMTAKTSSRAWRWLGCRSVAWWQWLTDGGDAGGVHPVRLLALAAGGRSGWH